MSDHEDSNTFDAVLEDYLLSLAIARDRSEGEYQGTYKLIYRIGNEREWVDIICLSELAKGILVRDETFIYQFKGQNLMQLDLVGYKSSKVVLRMGLEAAE